MKKFIWICAFWCMALAIGAQQFPKREFRGAWIQCVNGQFQGMSTEQLQRTLTEQLDNLCTAGINAVIFQVRPEADALYKSRYEPWSRFLTGEQGKAPSPLWDPLLFMVNECHRRGMELHAWINPYRAKTKGTKVLAGHHPSKLYPNRFIAYDGQLFFDPGLPENRKYICQIVTDIVSNYDIDALHMDDYFYPYPTPGLSFDDQASFARYGQGFTDIGDWRRNNVNLLIKEVMETVRSIKPWVKFGVSPFGIWRNRNSDPTGSDTKGLQNYDQLYADVLTWVKEGWVDYNIPQVYWEIGHPAADYAKLVPWWAEHSTNRPLFIGQDVMRTVVNADPINPSVHQQQAKMNMQRAYPEVIKGSCQWPASAVVENKGGYRDVLKNEYHRYVALQPLFPFIDNKAPGKVRKVEVVWTQDGPILFWTAPKAKTEMDRARQYVVYRFESNEKVNLEDATKIIAITNRTYYALPYVDGKTKYSYVVTALDRLHNESKAVKKKVKL